MGNRGIVLGARFFRLKSAVPWPAPLDLRTPPSGAKVFATHAEQILMKFPPAFALAMVVFGLLLSGCQSPPVRPSAPTAAATDTRNNCYSLLYQLLDQEKNVSLLHFIKREDSDLKQLIRRVSEASAAGASQLKEFAKQDPTLILDATGLPPGEVKTRDSIAAEQQHELLHNSGDAFELILLLNQQEAMNYATHLAKVASLNDFGPGRAQYLSGLSAEMKKLRDQIAARLNLRVPTGRKGK